MKSRQYLRLVVLFFLLGFFSGVPTLAGDLIQTAMLPFELGRTTPVALTVGALRVNELTVSEADQPVFASLLPPHGGQSRYSWILYGVRAENSSERRHKLAARVRLLDKNGAVIDEFEFRGSVRAGHYRVLELKRLTLNYIKSLVDHVELTVSQE